MIFSRKIINPTVIHWRRFRLRQGYRLIGKGITTFQKYNSQIKDAQELGSFPLLKETLKSGSSDSLKSALGILLRGIVGHGLAEAKYF